MTKERLALIGYGAMARSLAARLAAGTPPITVAGALVEAAGDAPNSIFSTTNVEELIAWRPTLVAECAGHGAVASVVPKFLAAGIDVIIASVGVLTDGAIRDRLAEAAQKGGGRLILPAGAIGGLDVLRAARTAGLDQVLYTGRKPPRAWLGTPAESVVDLAGLTEATVIFDGNASDAARLYPKNTNVTAAVALAGLGFEATKVRLVADPASDRNEHEIYAAGTFGDFRIHLRNVPLPENPKTSMLAALSLELEVRRQMITQPF